MNENTKKRNRYNVLVVKKLAKKYSLSEYYIRECLRDDAKSKISDVIRKDYKRMVKNVENALEQ